jgi:hypothetical protein
MPTLTGRSCAEALAINAMVAKSAMDKTGFFARLNSILPASLPAMVVQIFMQGDICQGLYIKVSDLTLALNQVEKRVEEYG